VPSRAAACKDGLETGASWVWAPLHDQLAVYGGATVSSAASLSV